MKLALHGETVDRPPCICPGGMMNMIVEELMDLTGSPWPEAHSDPHLMADLAAGIYTHGGFENYGVPFCMTVEAEAMGAPVFMGTKTNEPRVTAYPINSVSQWRELNNIDVTTGRAKVVLDAITLLKDRNSDVPVLANLTGPVSLASSLMEPVMYYKELHKNPRDAHGIMAHVTQNLITFGRAQLDAGATVLTISDPSGTGEILGPKMFRQYAVPYLNQIVDALKASATGGTIIHICGRLKSIYPELNMLTSDAISFDAITDVKQVAENVLGKVLMGNVSTFALENSPPEKIKRLAKNCINNGVKILSPACGIGPRTQLQNIQAMVETAKDCR
ncbi:MAG: hypothetical protein JEZ12_22125 [Desulfobacterium sp.]|nr:hypothetical protein [Desulfobacterium sp.]